MIGVDLIDDRIDDVIDDTDDGVRGAIESAFLSLLVAFPLLVALFLLLVRLHSSSFTPPGCVPSSSPFSLIDPGMIIFASACADADAVAEAERSMRVDCTW